MSDWKEGFKQGSTVFKEVLDKKGRVDHYECVVCGFEVTLIYLERGFESHEIMHLLQQIRAGQSEQNYEPIFPEEKPE